MTEFMQQNNSDSIKKKEYRPNIKLWTSVGSYFLLSSFLFFAFSLIRFFPFALIPISLCSFWKKQPFATFQNQTKFIGVHDAFLLFFLAVKQTKCIAYITCVYIFDGVVCIKSRQTDRQSEMDGMGFPIQFVYCLCEIRDVTVYSSRSYSTCSSAAQCILFKQFTSFSFSHFSIFGLDLKQRAYDCCMLHDSIYFYWKL